MTLLYKTCHNKTTVFFNELWGVFNLKPEYVQQLLNNQFQIHTPTGPSTKPHTHSFLELAYIAKGQGVHVFDEVETPVKKGDYFIVDFGVTHTYDGQPDMQVINLLFLPAYIDNTLRDCRSFQTVLNNYLIRFSPDMLPKAPTNRIFHDDGTVLSLLNKIEEEQTRALPGFREVVRCDLIKIILLTMRQICFDQPKEDAAAQIILREIAAHPAEPVSLSTVAENLHVSVAYISRRFKEQTGKTFTEAVRQARVESACRLLANSDKKVTEVAELCGYKDVKSFYGAFRECTGMTPCAYRKSAK